MLQRKIRFLRTRSGKASRQRRRSYGERERLLVTFIGQGAKGRGWAVRAAKEGSVQSSTGAISLANVPHRGRDAKEKGNSRGSSRDSRVSRVKGKGLYSPAQSGRDRYRVFKRPTRQKRRIMPQSHELTWKWRRSSIRVSRSSTSWSQFSSKFKSFGSVFPVL